MENTEQKKIISDLTEKVATLKEKVTHKMKIMNFLVFLTVHLNVNKKINPEH